jgi:hypothetical protein
MSFGDRPCLHCEVGDLVVEFMQKYPNYPKAEAAQDLMKIASQYISMCLETGVELGKEFEIIRADQLN